MVNSSIIKVPGTEKSINLQGLFDLIQISFPFEEDKISNIATAVDNVIRLITENISDDTNKEDLKAAFFTLYRVRDAFENLEI